MNKNISIYLQHIIESAELVAEYIKDKSQKDFLADIQLQDSVIRRIEIIGEAAKKIPDDFRKKYPDIPWRNIAGMRDIIVHEYFGIDLKLVWTVAKRDLPRLKKQLTGIQLSR